MEKQLNPKTMVSVMGNNVRPTTDGGFMYHEQWPVRTPLHIEFSSGSGYVPSEKIRDVGDPELFNAIGSRCINHHESNHLPVLDVDGGATLEHWKQGQKLVLRSKYDGSYSPSSNLVDVFGDYGIDVEVGTYTKLAPQGKLSTEVRTAGNGVGNIALRTREDIFEVVSSTSEGHSHVYIQKEFSEVDHNILIESLGVVGVLSGSWLLLTREEGMGVVRTPWTPKDIVAHRDS